MSDLPVVSIVGGSGFAAILAGRAEAIAASGSCMLGGAVVPPPPITSEASFDMIVSARRAAGWAVYDSPRELYAAREYAATTGGAELVALPLPIPLHAPMTIDALHAGFHVLCEKPAAGSRDELDQMRTAAERAQRSLWFGFQHPVLPGMATLLDHVARSLLGRVTTIAVWGSWPRSSSYYRRAQWAGTLSLRNRMVLDSPIQNALAHFLHGGLLVAHAAGYHPVSVVAEHARVYPIETADSQFLRIATADDAAGHGPEIFFAGTHAAGEHIDPTIKVVCAGGTLEWTYPDGLSVISDNGDRQILVPNVGSTDIVNGGALHAAVTRLGAPPNSEIADANLAGCASARLHLETVLAAFGNSPDSTFPPEAIAAKWTEVAGSSEDPVITIRGLPTDLRMMVQVRRLPTELGLQWARRVRRVESRIR